MLLRHCGRTEVGGFVWRKVLGGPLLWVLLLVLLLGLLLWLVLWLSLRLRLRLQVSRSAARDGGLAGRVGELVAHETAWVETWDGSERVVEGKSGDGRVGGCESKLQLVLLLLHRHTGLDRRRLEH
jgi:hypothetical protein